MKTITSFRLVHVAALTFGLLTCGAMNVQADNQNHGARGKTAVTGGFAWTIVPSNLTPQFVFVGTDSELHIRHLPLVGPIQIVGNGINIEGKATADMNGELDATLTGVIWGEATITAKVNGVKTIIFEGRFHADTVGLISNGKVTLRGRGPYEGRTLEFDFEELGPEHTDNYTLKGALAPAPRR